MTCYEGLEINIITEWGFAQGVKAGLVPPFHSNYQRSCFIRSYPGGRRVVGGSVVVTFPSAALGPAKVIETSLAFATASSVGFAIISY